MVSSKLNLPPNNCMPSRAKMTMNKKSRSSKLAMERILFSREATKLRSEFQYLIMAQYSCRVNVWQFYSNGAHTVQQGGYEVTQ